MLQQNGTPAPCARDREIYSGIRGLSLTLPKNVDWLDGFKQYVLPQTAGGSEGTSHGKTNHYQR